MADTAVSTEERGQGERVQLRRDWKRRLLNELFAGFVALLALIAGALVLLDTAPGHRFIVDRIAGIVDDLLVYRIDAQRYLLVVNAGTIIGHGTYDGFDAEPDSGIVFATEGSSVVNSGTITGPRLNGTAVPNSGACRMACTSTSSARSGSCSRSFI